MNDAILLRWVNPVLLISVIVQAVTGVILYFDLFISSPAIFRTMAEAHKHNGLILTALIITHIYLNWSWFKAQLFKK